MILQITRKISRPANKVFLHIFSFFIFLFHVQNQLKIQNQLKTKTKKKFGFYRIDFSKY